MFLLAQLVTDPHQYNPTMIVTALLCVTDSLEGIRGCRENSPFCPIIGTLVCKRVTIPLTSLTGWVVVV